MMLSPVERDTASANSVAVVCGAAYVSGKEVMALELATGLSDRGVTVTLVTSKWNNGDFRCRLTQAGLPYRVLPIGFISATMRWAPLMMTLDQLRHWPSLLYGFRDFLRAVRPARVVHTNWHHLLVLFPLLRPQRDLFWVHELQPASTRYRRLFRMLARRVGLFICVSDATAQSLRTLGVEERQIVVVPNGITDPNKGQRAPVDRGSAGGSLRVGIVGQVSRAKGHEDLLDAFGLLVQSTPAAELHIYGSGQADYVAVLKARCEALGLGPRVKWHGFVNNRHDIYSNLDICVVPSRFDEPFGLSALEPAFYALPVIAARRGGLPQVVEANVTGLLVDSGNAVALCGALKQLAANPALRSTLGERARAVATVRFSQATFIDSFIRLLGTTGDQP